MLEGQLKVDVLVVTQNGKTIRIEPRVVARAGRTLEIEIPLALTS
jgi:hypothetical protein